MPTGHYPGRNYAEHLTMVCPLCGLTFSYKQYVSQPPRQCCATCRPKMAGVVKLARSRVPHDRATLWRLYVDEKRTSVELGEMFGVEHHVILRRLYEADVPIRAVGASRWDRCVMVGCEGPAHKTYHKKLKSWYGRRCLFHYKEHRLDLAARYALKNVLSLINNEEEKLCLIQARKQAMRILSHQQGFSSRIVSPLASAALGQLKTSPSS